MIGRIAMCAAAIAIAWLLGPVASPAGEDGAFETSSMALPAVVAPTPIGETSTCATACQAMHDRCRVSTKGGPGCDGERQRCLQACIAKKSK